MLPPIVDAILLLVDQLDVLVPLACEAPILPEDTADRLSDAGHAAIDHSRTLMAEACRRKREGAAQESSAHTSEGVRMDSARSAELSAHVVAVMVARDASRIPVPQATR